LTGSQADGRAYTDTADHTCSNYTSNADGTGSVQLGHVDKQGGKQRVVELCTRAAAAASPNLVATGGAGLFYLFRR